MSRLIQQVGTNASAPGLDFASIVTLLTTGLPKIIDLFNQCRGNNKPATPSDYRSWVASRYRGHGKYRAGVVNRLANSLQESAANSGTELNDEHASAVAIEFLDTVRTSPDGQIKEALILAGLVPADNSDIPTPTV